MRQIARLLSLLVTTTLSPYGAKAQSQCDDYDFAVTKTPAPPLYAAAFRTHAAKAAQLATGAEVVIIGDSITEAWPADLLQGAFPGQRVVNYGIGGDRIQNALWRLRNPQITIAPRRVYILLGTNNLSTDKPCAIVGGMLDLVAQIRAEWYNPAIYIIDILPRGADSLQFAERRIEIAALLREKTSQSGINIFDFSESLSCPEGQICEKYRSDYVHLTRLGYIALADALAVSARR